MCVKICSNSVEKSVLKQKEALKKKWIQFGWQDRIQLIDTHFDFCQFLRISKIFKSIEAYQQSSLPESHPLKEGIRMDGDHPCLLMEGNWTRWEEISKRICYNFDKREILCKQTNQEWNYFYDPSSPDRFGLVPESRNNQVRPIYQLSKGEQENLNLKNDQYAIQVFTSHNNSVFKKMSHVGLRLIDNKGWVYSLGFETPSSVPKFPDQRLVGNYDAAITTLDYDEFASFSSRRVTTIPISENSFTCALERIKVYTSTHLRFNRVHQNCVTYTADIMKSAGIAVPDFKCSIRSALWDNISDLTIIGPVLNKIKRAVYWVFKILAAIPLLGLFFQGLDWFSNKMATLITNSLLMACGAKYAHTPSSDENKVDNRDRLTYFQSFMTGLKDLFNSEKDHIYTPLRLVNWQLDQGDKTVIHLYHGLKFYISPKQ